MMFALCRAFKPQGKGCSDYGRLHVLFFRLFVYNLLEKKTCVIFAKRVDLKVKAVLFKDKIILMKSLSYDIFFYDQGNEIQKV